MRKIKRNKKKTGFNFRKYFKSFAIRFSYRLIELAALIALGSLLGLHLVKY